MIAAAILAAALALVPAAPAAAQQSYPRPADGTYELAGRGYGHGIGLSQWGARGAAEAGRSTGEILRFYYPGTSLKSTANVLMRVWMTADRDNVLTVVGRPGMTARVGTTTVSLPRTYRGRAIQYWLVRRLDGTRYRLGFSAGGRWYAYRINGTANLPGPVTLGRPGYPLLLVRPDSTRQALRGWLRGIPDGPHPGMRTVNESAIDTYLRGVVPAEMPALWHSTALRAQAIAARTYSLRQRNRNPSGSYHICDTTTCQVFVGVATYDRYNRLLSSGEHSRTDAAVQDTGRTVLRDSAGNPVLTMFSAGNGGWTVDGGLSYLPAQEDPWDGQVPNNANAWTATMQVSRVEQAFPAVGRLSRIEVVSRDGNGDWGGRIQSLRLVGSTGSAVVDGREFRFALGLRSTLWTVS